MEGRATCLLSWLSQAPELPTAQDDVSVQRPQPPPETQGPKVPGQQGQPPYFPGMQPRTPRHHGQDPGCKG